VPCHVGEALGGGQSGGFGEHSSVRSLATTLATSSERRSRVLRGCDIECPQVLCAWSARSGGRGWHLGMHRCVNRRGCAPKLLERVTWSHRPPVPAAREAQDSCDYSRLSPPPSTGGINREFSSIASMPPRSHAVSDAGRVAAESRPGTRRTHRFEQFSSSRRAPRLASS